MNKRNRLFNLFILIPLIAGCALTSPKDESEPQSEIEYSEKESELITESEEESVVISETEETSEKESEIESEPISEEESESEIISESEQESEKESEQESESENPIKTIEIYASNDVHGRVLEEDGSMGLKKYGTFMKERKEEGNTLLLDQGDTWQGSIYSNINYGNLFTDVMSYARFDARTLGNHDFDWGVEKIIENKNRSYDGYTIPNLAANLYDFDFDTKTVGDVYQSQLASKTTTRTLENGVKVGIVGAIGKDQISTINSLYTLDIAFTDHIAAIKEEATRLRDEEGCDIVIASCHTGQEDMLNNNLSDYVDLVLCGHTHRREATREDGVLYAQFGRNNEYIGHITMTYDSDNKTVTNTTYENLSSYVVSSYIDEIDPVIDNLVDDACSKCDEEANEVLASNVSGNFDKSGESVHVMCNAVIDEVLDEGMDDVIFSFCNSARVNLPRFSWTYADLYESFPFDNIVYIIEVSGQEIINEVIPYNNICRSPNFDGKISRSQKYKIACIDFLAFHTNSNRYFDYFPENDGNYITFLNDSYRIILRDWLRENGYNNGVLMSASDYSSSLTKFSKNFTIDG